MDSRKFTYEYVKNYIEVESNSGCKLLSAQYNLVTDILHLKCKCTNSFYVSFNDFKNVGRQCCKKCSTAKIQKENSFSYEEMKNKINDLGYELISKEYINANKKIIIKDKEGYLYHVTYGNLYYKGSTRKFHKSNPYTILNIKLWCTLNNRPFNLMSNEFKGTHKKLKWKCLRKDCGAIFESAWAEIQSNKGCSYCVGQKVGLINCLATKNPELAKEWHPTKNGHLTPFVVTSGANKKVWWKCNKEHEWKDTISHRSNGRNCPYCSGKYPTKENNLLLINPELCVEWDYAKNKKKPEEYTPWSGQKVWWKCKEGHEWKTSISNRSKKGSGCPYCSGYYPSENHNLLNDNPKLCEEWDYEKNNKKPEEYCPSSETKVYWVCKECNYEWMASIAGRNSVGNGCPNCNFSRGEKRISEIFNLYGFIKILNEEYDNEMNKYQCFIPQKTFNDLVGTGGGLLSYDFYLPEYNLLIEYQGEQHEHYCKGFHASKKVFEKQQEHDKRKREFAENNKIKLLEIWYYDFDNVEQILNKELNIKTD